MSVRKLLYTAEGVLIAPLRILLFLAVAFVAGLAIGGAAAAALGAAALGGILGSTLVVTAALLVAHGVMLRWVDHRPWASVWMGAEAAAPRRLLTGTALGLVAIGVPTGLLLAAGWLDLQPAADGSWWGAAAWMTLVLAPAALWEELLFRGYVFAALRDALGTVTALCLTSAAFGIVHVSNPGSDPRALGLVAVAGVFLGGVLLITGSLYAAWLAHLAWNWIMAVIFHVSVSGNPFPTPDYRVVDAGPDWITGGAWGPEGGMGALAGMAASLGYLMLRRRRPER